MKKTTLLNTKGIIFLTITIIVMTAAAQVSASNDHANKKSTNNPSTEKRNEHSINENENEVNDEDVVASITPSGAQISVIPVVEDSNNEDEDKCDDDVKNHGQYVSCVAKTHPGGKEVSIAARSDIGKKNHKTPTVTTSPGVSPSVTPSLSITPTDNPTATPSVTVSPTPTESISQNQQIESLINELKGLLKALRGFLRL